MSDGNIKPSNSRKRKRLSDEKPRWVNFYDEQLSLGNFMKAIDSNDIEMVQVYLQHGQDPNEHAGNYVTPLHIASMHGFEYLVQLLLQLPNIDVNPVDYLGRTPLSRACRYSYLNIVQLLLDHDADSNLADRTGYTPLHHTAIWGWTDIMEVLLKYEANPNVVNAFGKTPLHIATVDNPNVTMVHLLCGNGADINLECALVMPVLLVCCLNCFDYEDLNMIDLLIHYDADVNIVHSPSGQTAMHLAAITGFVPLAEVLCTAGANPNAMDKQFRTPYDVAVQMENDEMINFLRLFFEEEILPESGTSKRRNAVASIFYRNKRKKNYETF